MIINLAVTVPWHDRALLVGVAKFVSSWILLNLEVFTVRILLSLSHAILKKLRRASNAVCNDGGPYILNATVKSWVTTHVTSRALNEVRIL